MSPRSPEVLFALLLCLGLQRLFELRRSRRNLRALGVGGQKADPTSNWLLMIVVQAGWILGTGAELALRGAPAPAPIFWSGLGLLLLAQALRLWCLRTLGRQWNARAVVHPSTRIVTTGPYRWLRHPNYLAVVLELLALPAAAGAWVTLLVVNTLNTYVLRVRIRGEEALLGELSGYAAAMGQKGGLVPRLRRARHRPGVSPGSGAGPHGP